MGRKQGGPRDRTEAHYCWKGVQRGGADGLNEKLSAELGRDHEVRS